MDQQVKPQPVLNLTLEVLLPNFHIIFGNC